MTVGIVDYGIGNLRSIQKAFEYFGVKAVVSDNLDELFGCKKIVLPGVGAFAHCKTQLDARFTNISKLLVSRPTLGICVGMQLMFDYSSEHGETEGLGLIKGHVDKLVAGSLPLPHTGWNSVLLKPGAICTLFNGIPDKHFFYFNHSFSCWPEQRSTILGTVDYGISFVSVVAQNDLYGIQFHPEKSGIGGIKILKNFYELC